MDAAEGRQQHESQDTAGVRRVGCTSRPAGPAFNPQGTAELFLCKHELGTFLQVNSPK